MANSLGVTTTPKAIKCCCLEAITLLAGGSCCSGGGGCSCSCSGGVAVNLAHRRCHAMPRSPCPANEARLGSAACGCQGRSRVLHVVCLPRPTLAARGGGCIPRIATRISAKALEACGAGAVPPTHRRRTPLPMCGRREGAGCSEHGRCVGQSCNPPAVLA